MHSFVIITAFLIATAHADKVKTEALSICIDCQHDDLNQLKIAAEKIESELKNKANICDSKGLINTKRQAQINKWLTPKNEGPDTLEYLFRQTVSCIYGLGEGAIFAVGSLVKGIGDLTSGAYNSGKDLVQYFKDNSAEELIKKLDLKKLSDNIKITTGKTVASITQSISKMSNSVKKTYQDIGFQGTLSMIGFEMWQKSPHHVIKKFLKKAVDEVGQYLSKESQRFNCLDNESKAELMCKLISSVGTDVAVGAGISKLIILGKGAFVTTKAHLLKSTPKVSVDEQLTHAAEMMVQSKTPKQISEILKTYNISKNLSQSSTKLLSLINPRDQQYMLKLLNTAQESKTASHMQLNELIDSLSELPKKTLDQLDVSTILNESEQALKLGQPKIIKDWASIVKTNLKSGKLGCYSKLPNQK